MIVANQGLQRTKTPVITAEVASVGPKLFLEGSDPLQTGQNVTATNTRLGQQR
jgi:hypothetical protein